MPSQPPRSIGKLHGMPELPPHYLPREAVLTGLKQKLLSGDSSVAITGQGQAVGVQGMAGIGKTVLAAALATRFGGAAGVSRWHLLANYWAKAEPA